MTGEHTHPDLELGLTTATGILLDIRTLLDTRLGALEAGLTTVATSIVNLDHRLQRIEYLLDERLGRNGPAQP